MTTFLKRAVRRIIDLHRAGYGNETLEAALLDELTATPQPATIGAVIERVIVSKQGNREFSLSFFPNRDGSIEPTTKDSWSACIGNKCTAVHINESGAELYGEGKTALAAVEDLLHNIRQTQRNK